MDDVVMKRLLEADLGVDARTAIVLAYDEAYRQAGSMYKPNVGLDAQWLGFTLFKLGTDALGKMATTGQFGFRDASEGGWFRLGFGRFLMTPYSCGYSAPLDAWKRFPS